MKKHFHANANSSEIYFMTILNCNMYCIVNEYIMKKHVNNDAPSDKIQAHYKMFDGAQWCKTIINLHLDFQDWTIFFTVIRMRLHKLSIWSNLRK